MSVSSRVVFVRVSDDLHREVRVMAAKFDVSIAAITKQALIEFLIEHKDEDRLALSEVHRGKR